MKEKESCVRIGNTRMSFLLQYLLAYKVQDKQISKYKGPEAEVCLP